MAMAKVGVLFLFLASGVNATVSGNDNNASTSDWPNGSICAVGTTCSECKDSWSWWSSKSFTACGTQPANLTGCATDADTAVDSACTCGDTLVCGIGHFCYDSVCHRHALKDTCTVDAVTAVTGSSCFCGGSLIAEAEQCTIGQYCYDSACAATAKPNPPCGADGSTAVSGANCTCGGTLVQSVLTGYAICADGQFCYDSGCHAAAQPMLACATDAATAVTGASCTCGDSVCVVGKFCNDATSCSDAAVDDGTDCKINPDGAECKKGLSTGMWILVGCAITVAVGALIAGIAFMMGCFGGSKSTRGLKKTRGSSKKSQAATAPQQLEEAQPLVQSASTNVMPIYSQHVQAPMFMQPTNMIPAHMSYAQPVQSYAQPSHAYSPGTMSYAQPVQTYAQPVQMYSMPTSARVEPTAMAPMPQYPMHAQGM